MKFSRDSTATAVMIYNDLDFSGISGDVRVVGRRSHDLMFVPAYPDTGRTTIKGR